MSSAFSMFVSCFLVLFLINVSVPYINESFGVQNLSFFSTTKIIEDMSKNSEMPRTVWYLLTAPLWLIDLLLFLFNMLVWNFNANFYLNLFFLTPLRIMFGVTLWYVLSPSK